MGSHWSHAGCSEKSRKILKVSRNKSVTCGVLIPGGCVSRTAITHPGIDASNDASILVFSTGWSGPGEGFQDGIVQEAVGRERAATIGPCLPGEVGKASPGLFDDRL